MLRPIRSLACTASAVAMALAAWHPAWAGPQENKNVAIVQAYFAAISGKAKPDTTLDIYVADKELKQHIGFFEAAFPHYVMVSEDLIAQGDEVAVRARFQGTQTGDLMGIAPTGKMVDVPFIIIYRMAGGKVAQHWMSIDQMDLLKQLGAVK
jgi:predicted ester cyclase